MRFLPYLLLVLAAVSGAVNNPPGLGTVPITNYGVDCTGATNNTTQVQAALTAAAGRTLTVKTGCRILIGSPGAGATALTVSPNTFIRCEDPSAGFVVDRKRCSGGTYDGASCSTNADCNWCADASCAAATCVGSQFAPTGGSTYGLFTDNGAPASSVGIGMEHCTLWTYQAEPYQRCAGGTNAGKPCDQKCGSSTFAGFRCETDGNCVVGVCLNKADCATAGGTCGGVPLSPSGTGKINPLNFGSTASVQLTDVAIVDHFIGDYAIKTGGNSRILQVDTTQSIDNCNEASNTTFGIGTACYGAIGATNVQPTVAVATGIDVGAVSQVANSVSRGSTLAFKGSNYTRFDENFVAPESAYGPGTASCGYETNTLGIVAKSRAIYLKSGCPGINLLGVGASAVEDRLAGAFSNGITINGANSHAVANNITGLTGTGYGIEADGQYDYVGGNYIDGNSSGAGVRVNAHDVIVQGNTISSIAVNTLDTGIQVEADQNPILTDNNIRYPELYGIWLKGAAFNFKITANDILLSAAVTAALKPQHVMDDGDSQQGTIVGNYFSGGWRGFATGTAHANGLTNTFLSGNRWWMMAGPPIAAGGAGIQFVNNYINANAIVSASYCDPSCTSMGIYCTTDADCGTCSSTRKCLPEPIIGFIGAPMYQVAASHNVYMNNLMYDGHGGTKQCGGSSTNLGQVCTTAASSCGGGGTCTAGTPAKCTGGTEANKLCCTGTPTCSVRDQSPMLRLTEYTAAAGSADTSISNNTVLAVNTDTVWIDGVASGALGNLQVIGMKVGNNHVYSASASNTTAIRLPNTFNTMTGLDLTSNNYLGWGTVLSGWQHAMGSLAMANQWTAFGGANASLRTTAGTDYFAFSTLGAANATETGTLISAFVAPLAGSVWSFNCWITAAAGSGVTRTITARKNAADAGGPMSCAITGTTAVRCSPAAGSASAPFTFAAGDKLTFKEVVSGGTAAAAEIYCQGQVSYDTF